MDIISVMQVTKEGKQKAAYQYKNDSLLIFLNREYTRDENYTVWIDYVSKPDDLQRAEVLPYENDKGLYFIMLTEATPISQNKSGHRAKRKATQHGFPPLILLTSE
jgi:aminopeptidase N